MLGIQLLPLLDYPDGRLAEYRTARLAQPIAQAILREKADIVLTFGPEALTGHPDHLAIHRATTLAFEMAAQPGTALFYAGLSEFDVARLSTRLEGSFGGFPLMLKGAQGIELDTAIDVAAYSRFKWSALACHHTQAAGFQNLNASDLKLLGQREYFRLKMVAGKIPTSPLRAVESGPRATNLFDRIGLYEPLTQIA